MMNKERIEAVLQEEGYTLGICHPEIQRLDEENLKKVLEAVGEAWTDVEVVVDGVPSVVEISTVDSERDLCVLTKAEYESRYGKERS